MVIGLIIVAIIYCALPWYIEIIAWIINLFLVDTVPLIDELLMFVPMISKIKKISKVAEILEMYWKWIVVLIVLALVIAIYVIVK